MTAANLLQILDEQENLYELHTHLLGMGNASFWIQGILTDQAKLPPQYDFENNDLVRKHLGPLVWDRNARKFISPGDTMMFFDKLRAKEDFDKLCNLPDFVMFKCLKSNDFTLMQSHLGLTFQEHFSYDIVFSIENLRDALSLKSDEARDMVQAIIEEKLGIYTRSDWQEKEFFKHWIIFNARKQELEVVYGMTAEDLRILIGGAKPIHHLTDPAQRDARAHIINAFSMMNADGSEPRSVDFHSFRGSFTPEFYPRRFALKDSLYSQRLDLLAFLLQNALHRFLTCLPPITYCEFSVSYTDLSRAWVLDVLSTFSTSQQLTGTFKTLVNNKNFPWLKTQFSKQNIDYRFLAGFNRKISKLSKDYSSDRALAFLFEVPHYAIYLMFREFYRSDNQRSTLLFTEQVEQLQLLIEEEKKNSHFFDWVVGLDLFGDELGYPYCPFVAYEFLRFVQDARKKNSNFGVRIHCAENVPFVRPELHGYRLFAAHMYIVYRSLHFLRQKLKQNIRIGHGIAFDKLLSIKNYKYRKSSVLVAEMQNVGSLLSSIPFEINITSNIYLLGDAIRNVESKKPLNYLYEIGVPIVLSTDDDGIWPIDKCPLEHQAHHSLAAEYCRAISTHFITREDQLRLMIDNTKKFCFADDKNLVHCNTMTLANYVNTCTGNYFPTDVIMHPMVFRTFLSQAQNGGQVTDDYRCFKYYQNIYERMSPDSTDDDYSISKECCKRVAPIAVASFYLTRSLSFEEFKIEYDILFNDDYSKKTFDVCETIYSQLMDDTPSQCVRTQVKIDGKDYLFFSDQLDDFSQSPDSFMNTIERFIMHCSKTATVFAFLSSNHLNDTEKMLKIKNIEQKIINKDIKVYIFTNFEKDSVLRDFKSNIIYINKKPKERTDPDEEQIECALYAVCPHSGVATAALTFVAKNMKKNLVFVPQHIQLINLIIPFLPLRFGYPEDSNEEERKKQFLNRYNISDRKIAEKITVENNNICKTLYDPKYDLLCSEVKYADQIEMKNLIKLIDTLDITQFLEILKFLCNSIKELNLWPRFFVIIDYVSDYESYEKSNDFQKIPLRMIKLEHKLLICSRADLFEKKTPSTVDCLWSVAVSWNPPLYSKNSPYENPCSEWVTSIINIERQTLNDTFGPDTWDRFLYKIIMEAKERAWLWYTVRSWCDIIHNAFASNTEDQLKAFAGFLKNNNYIDDFTALLKDEDRYKLGNLWQIEVIEKHQAYTDLKKIHSLATADEV
ncbi:unnamed protein product [Adineta ricciae]|nr:unnamed protein product [Adineta ricciae]